MREFLIFLPLIWLMLGIIAVSLIRCRKDAARVKGDILNLITVAISKNHFHLLMTLLYLYLIMPISIIFSINHLKK